MTSWRSTAMVTSVMSAIAILVLSVALARDGASTPFGPGELDVLLAARSIAAGVIPPIWVGAVHPDAIGTWLGALNLAPLLRLGFSDVVALKSLAALHFALLVGASSGLAARRGGVLAGVLTGLVLTLGAPALVAAHSKYLATTVEIAGVEVALLWVTLELMHLERRPLWAVSLLGALLGLVLVYSLHAGVLLILVAGALLRARKRRRSTCIALLIPSVLVWVPFVLARDPLGPQRAALSIKTLGPGQLLGLLDPSDLMTLITRAPLALLYETEHLAPDAWQRWLHVPLAFLLATTLLVAAVFLARRTLPEAESVILLFGLGTAAPLLLAGDLLGYPAAYRYYAPVFAPAAILLSVGVARGAPSRATRLAAAGVVTLLVLPGFLTVPRATATELNRPMASYFAGQHRLGFAQYPLHTHFLMLTPFVRDDELPGWLQGYGVHLGREFTRQAPIAAVEYSDRRPDPGTAIPDVVDRLYQKMQPSRWLRAADWLGGDAREHLLLGVGLGIAEDGVLDPRDLELLEELPLGQRPAIWRGVGGAMGERWFWTQNATALLVEGSPEGLDQQSGGAFLGGLVTTGGTSVPPLEQFLDETLRPPGPVLPAPGQRFAHPHPFTYADLGVLGRGEVPMGPR